MSDGKDPQEQDSWLSAGKQEPPWPESQTQSGWWGAPSKYPIEHGPYDFGFGNFGNTQFQPDPRQFYPPERVYSRLAIMAACFSFGSFLIPAIGVLSGPAGAVMGHIAMARMKRTRHAGHGLALASVIVGWLAFVLNLIGDAVLLVYVVHQINTGGTSWDLPGSSTDDGSTNALAFLF